MLNLLFSVVPEIEMDEVAHSTLSPATQQLDSTSNVDTLNQVHDARYFDILSSLSSGNIDALGNQPDHSSLEVALFQSGLNTESILIGFENGGLWGNLGFIVPYILRAEAGDFQSILTLLSSISSYSEVTGSNLLSLGALSLFIMTGCRSTDSRTVTGPLVMGWNFISHNLPEYNGSNWRNISLDELVSLSSRFQETLYLVGNGIPNHISLSDQEISFSFEMLNRVMANHSWANLMEADSSNSLRIQERAQVLINEHQSTSPFAIDRFSAFLWSNAVLIVGTSICIIVLGGTVYYYIPSTFQVPIPSINISDNTLLVSESQESVAESGRNVLSSILVFLRVLIVAVDRSINS